MDPEGLMATGDCCVPCAGLVDKESAGEAGKLRAALGSSTITLPSQDSRTPSPSSREQCAAAASDVCLTARKFLT